MCTAVKKKPPELKIIFLAGLATYCIAGLFLLPLYRYQINPDGISYISIAQKYAGGEFYDAINGYWSPLFSWLLVPGVYFGVEPLLFSKLLNLCIGVIVIAGVCFSARSLHLRHVNPWVLTIVLIPVVLNFAYAQLTPDLLTACLLVFYTKIIFDAEYPSKSHSGLWAGIVGGFAYLSKNYCLPFFILHFSIMHILHFCSNASPLNRRKLSKHFLKGFIVFGIIVIPWICLLSCKYGKITFSTAGSINLANLHPQASAMHVPRFVAPPDPKAYSVWDDPYYVLGKYPSNPFESVAFMKRVGRAFIYHANQTLQFFISYSLISFILLISYLAISLILNKHAPINNKFILYSVIFIILYSSGYFFVHVEDRFFMIVCLLFILMGMSILDRLYEFSIFKKLFSIILVLFYLSFWVQPVINLYTNANSGRDIYRLGQAIKKHVLPNSKIALSDDWYTSLFLVYHLQGKLYGTTEELSAAEVRTQFDTHCIDYFIAWDGMQQYPFLSDFKLLDRIPCRDKFVGVYKIN